MGWALTRFLGRAMLRNEHRAYTKLSGLRSVPYCYGLLDGTYLVLKYVEGVPIRRAEITDRALFFDSLLAAIKDFHKAGVAHADLKKKDNLLVVDGRMPCIIDFGTAVIRKNGFAPVNCYLYSLARKFDFNAWAKLKYNGRFEQISKEDQQYYDRTIVEKVSRWIKQQYLKVKESRTGPR
jgi:tRNA A-37 threonylcarbamoyl transferase component Bud32